MSHYLVNLVRRGAGLAPRNLLEPVITPDSLPITGLPLHDGGDILPDTHGEWLPVAPRVEPLSPQASPVPVASVSPLAPSVLRPAPQPVAPAPLPRLPERTVLHELPSPMERQMPPELTPAPQPLPEPSQWRSEDTSQVLARTVPPPPPSPDRPAQAATMQPRAEVRLWQATPREQSAATPSAPAEPPPARREIRETRTASPPDVRVRIGRVEIRVNQPPAPPAAAPTVPPRGFAELSLARQYLDRTRS